MRSRCLVGLMVGFAAVSIPIFPQNIVSARAGLIHYSEGRVLLNETPVVHKAAEFREVKEQDYLRTEEGRAEVLLTPGIFLRLGEHSDMQMLSTRLSDVRLTLLTGSAVIEADELDKANSVTVLAGDSSVQLLQKGLYRLDVENGAPQLRVFAGEALVTAPGIQSRVKAKKEMELAGNYAIQKFDPEDTDALDRWSRRRASYVSAANVSASAMAYNNGVSYSNSLWAWNPIFGMFTFLPCQNVAWSPYGYGFFSPGAVYYYLPQPRVSSYPGGYAAGLRAPVYNSSYGYNTVAPTPAGHSGVIASARSGGSMGPIGASPGPVAAPASSGISHSAGGRAVGRSGR
jgi:hypothetical protein